MLLHDSSRIYIQFIQINSKCSEEVFEFGSCSCDSAESSRQLEEVPMLSRRRVLGNGNYHCLAQAQLEICFKTKNGPVSEVLPPNTWCVLNKIQCTLGWDRKTHRQCGGTPMGRGHCMTLSSTNNPDCIHPGIHVTHGLQTRHV